MALYALGDLHLSFQADKPMDSFGKVWKNHEKKIEKYANRMVKPEDTLVLTGDHSWGRKLQECREDLAFIERLPGRKILLRGNHDMFWDAKKTEKLNEEYKDRLFFLQNNFAVYQDYAMKLSPYAVPESGFSMAVGIDHRRNLIFLCDLCKRRTFF